MTLRFLSLLVFLTIVTPLGALRKALGGSRFGPRMHAGPSSWDRARKAPPAGQPFTGAPHVERHL